MKKSSKIILSIVIPIVSIVLAITMVLGVVLLALAAPVIYIVGGWAAVFVGGLAVSMLQPNPPAPSVTYGEFPFEIVYELDGETITVNDVYVCEFDGYSVKGGIGAPKEREWKGYLKSTGKDRLVLLEDGNLKFVCAVGYPEYYMSDPSKPNVEYTPFLYYIIYPNEFGGESQGISDIEQLQEQYKLKLISWKLSEPIENTFEYKLDFFRTDRKYL